VRLPTTAAIAMRKLILPAIFMGFMLLNAALFVFITREFADSNVTTKRTVTQPEMRQR
jgi:hypothetical protein